MKHETFVISGHEACVKLERFIRFYHQNAYESSFEGGFLRFFLYYSFLNSNKLMFCIRFDNTKCQDNTAEIEIIIGGASDSIWLHFTMGSYTRRLNRFSRKLEEFCIEQGLAFSVKT